MPTAMHRLQISLPEWQAQFLSRLARRNQVSIAEIIRRLIQREAESAEAETAAESLWEIAGIATDDGPLVAGVPVSESPELYLTEVSAGEKSSLVSDRSEE